MAWIELTVNDDKLYVNMDLIASFQSPGKGLATQLTPFGGAGDKARILKVRESPQQIMELLDGKAAKGAKGASVAR